MSISQQALAGVSFVAHTGMHMIAEKKETLKYKIGTTYKIS